MLYLSPRLSTSSQLYGSLGTAATLLLGVYIVARVVLAATTLNVTIADVLAQRPPGS